jgi:hypothetical protein
MLGFFKFLKSEINHKFVHNRLLYINCNMNLIQKYERGLPVFLNDFFQKF